MDPKHNKQQNKTEDLKQLIAYITGEISPDDANDIENKLIHNPEYLKSLSSIIKDEECQLSAAEEAEFAAMYKAPKKQDRETFIRAVLQNSEPPATTIRRKLPRFAFAKATWIFAIALLFVLLLTPTIVKYLPDNNQFCHTFFYEALQNDALFYSIDANGVADSPSILRGPEAEITQQIIFMKNQFMVGLGYFLDGKYNTAGDHMNFLLQKQKYRDDLNQTTGGQKLLSDIYCLHALSRLSLALDLRDDSELYKQNLTAAISALQTARDYANEKLPQNSGKELYFLGLAYKLNDDDISAQETLSQISPEQTYYKKSNEILTR